MNLNPLKWFQGDRVKLAGQNLSIRESAAQGPFTNILSHYILREAAPYLYEALREAIPTLDGAVDKVVMLDGIIRMEAESDALQNAFEDWAMNVQVNDMQHGLQTFYELQSNEIYEQGLAIGTFTLAENGRNVERLWVGDSKGVYFSRPGGPGNPLLTWYRAPAPDRFQKDGTTQVERVLRNNYQTGNIAALLEQNGYTRMNPETLIYANYKPEADNPYGTSIFRSLPFVSKILLTMDNAMMQAFERFGNPAFNVVYKTNNRQVSGDATELETRRKSIADNLHTVLTTKRQGNSADMVNAIGKDDELTVKVLGDDGQVLDIEQPGRHVQEQMVAKFPVPSWMLGFHWSTAERLAQRQGEIALQESRTRFEKRLPPLTRLVTTVLRARGQTWKQGDWQLVQDLPSLQDLVAQAQARFLDAQTQMMLSNSDAQPAVVDNTGKIYFPGDPGYQLMLEKAASTAPAYDLRDPKKKVTGTKSETWAENGDVLTRLEQRGESFLIQHWSDLGKRVIDILGLANDKTVKAPETFTFDAANVLQDLLDSEHAFIATAGEPDKNYIQSLVDGWSVGFDLAEKQIDNFVATEAALESVRQEAVGALQKRGLELLRNTTIREYEDGIIDGLQQGAYDGMNRADVARALRNTFGNKEYNWTRLVQTELTTAHADAKDAMYAANEIGEYDYVTAGDSKVSAICRELAAGGPYTVGNGPMPGRDSHPGCRCTTVPHLDG